MAKLQRIDIRVTEDEKAQLKRLAQDCGFNGNVSAYLLALGFNQPVTSTIDRQALGELRLLGADLKRLGNLFKLSIDQGMQHTFFEQERSALNVMLFRLDHDLKDFFGKAKQRKANQGSDT